MDEVEKHVHERFHYIAQKEAAGVKLDTAVHPLMRDLDEVYANDTKFEYIKKKALIDEAYMDND